jgi:hypothetical protein
MKKLFAILILQFFVAGKTQCQSFTVDELITLADLPSKNIEHYMSKKGYVLFSRVSDSTTMNATFTPNIKGNKKILDPARSIDIDIKNNSKYFTLHTSALNEFFEGELRLIKEGFFYDTLKDIKKEYSMLFQKANVTVKTTTQIHDGAIVYSFNLKEKGIPSSIKYAEDLLQFDSHEYLVSFFGEQNVKKDLYYLTDKDLKKCSILFSGTPRQAVFIWSDDINLNDLLYILVTNSLPTEGAKKTYPVSQNNEWQLKCGIYPGMGLRDLLKINETDFDIYGNKSELAFLVKPNEYGKIDFKKTAVMLSCHECFDNKIFNQKEVSALDVAKANIPLRVFDIAIYPSFHD